MVGRRALHTLMTLIVAGSGARTLRRGFIASTPSAPQRRREIIEGVRRLTTLRLHRRSLSLTAPNAIIFRCATTTGDLRNCDRCLRVCIRSLARVGVSLCELGNVRVLLFSAVHVGTGPHFTRVLRPSYRYRASNGADRVLGAQSLAAHLACHRKIQSRFGPARCGRGSANNLGANFNMLFYRWVPRANDGLITYDRSPALSLVLPRTSVLARDGVVASWLHGQPAPKELPAAADYRH